MSKRECINTNRRFLFIIICVFAFSFSWSQGIVRGMVTDENGEPAIGATVVLKSNKAIGASINFDGSYSLKITDSIPQALVVSLVGYKTIEEQIHIKTGQVLIKNFDMKPAATEIKEVEVVAKANKAKEYYMEKVKMNSVTSMDYISAETMKKTGDANVTAAVARVPGVSTTSNGFITIRGIGDRYVKTTLNKSTIPTLDPYTNNIKLDIFPSSLVDNVVLVKTASPDLPGDWAGAYISVETKDYPEKLMLNVESSFGYNDQSTFKEVITSQRSSTDWLGFDNNFRDKNHNDFSPATIKPTQYEELVALGLGNYYGSLGVTSTTPWNDTYFKLGLVQLGLLAPALFDDADAVKAAKSAYQNGTYSADAFSEINADAVQSSRSFPNNWNTSYAKAPLNFSQSFSIGNQKKLFGSLFGFITGFKYGSSFIYDPNASVNRGTQINGINLASSKATEQASKENNGWSALINTAYKFTPNNSISLLFMPNFTGANYVRYTLEDQMANEFEISKQQQYEQRRQLIYQAKTENYFAGPQIKTELSASYTDGKSSMPDFKRLTYSKNKNAEIYQIGGDRGIDRSYRYLSDNIFDAHLNAELLAWNKPGLIRKIILGGSYQENHKKSDQYNYAVRSQTLAINFDGDVDSFFDPSRFDIRSFLDNGIPTSALDLYYVRYDHAVDHMFGYGKIKSGFLMLDYAIISSVRFSGGLRAEQAYIYTDVAKYDSLGLAPDDPRRYEPGTTFAARPGKLNEKSYLPSASVIYKLKKDESAPINLRLNYSQTVARPSIRELAEVEAYDYELRAMIFGNSDLKMVRIYNYDFRIESYFKSGDNVSLSVFYKDFKDHIEVTFAPQGYTWQNVDKSTVQGIELEGRKTLFRNLELRANITAVKSSTTYMQKALLVTNGVKEYTNVGQVSRTMFGQSPYVVNGILTYKADSIGLNLSLSYNTQGRRLVIANFSKELEIYELPRNLFDFKITKTIGKHFSTSVTVRDILNAPIIRAYNFPKDQDILYYDKYAYGTNYILGISYKL